MGSVASIDNCYKDSSCCPDLEKFLEDKNESSYFQEENEIKEISKMSIENSNNNIINNDSQKEDNESMSNDQKIEANQCDDNNEEKVQKFEKDNLNNDMESLNDNNNSFDSSQKSVHSSNFSFKNSMKKKEEKKENNTCNNSKKEKEKMSLTKENYLTKVKIIQKIFRAFINKKHSEQKTNFEDENAKKKKFSSTRKNPKIKNFKNYSSLLLNRYLEDMDYVEVSNESFRSLIIKSNKLHPLETRQFFTLREMENDHVKGYFLLKKKAFKYHGEKDENGKKVGFGRILWEDSSKLKGYFTDSKLNGIVYFYNYGSENSTFFGEYKENVPNGYGIYSRKGYKLEGNNWLKNNLNDIGVAVWDEGEIYEGEFINSVKEGVGFYRWADGTTYMGQFQKNKITGYGRMNFSNGNVYEGEFNEGYLSGWGKFIWEDGKYYIGNYLKDKKHGFGIFVWNLKPLLALVGFWNQGKQNGICIKLYNGHYKIIFIKGPKSSMELQSKYEISKYLLPNQMKYKTLLKKKFH